jgi:hypothetical protein
MYIGNRLTQMNSLSASAFKNIVDEIREEICNAWKLNLQALCIHPQGSSTLINLRSYFRMKLMMPIQVESFPAHWICLFHC